MHLVRGTVEVDISVIGPRKRWGVSSDQGLGCGVKNM